MYSMREFYSWGVPCSSAAIGMSEMEQLTPGAQHGYINSKDEYLKRVCRIES